MDMKKVLFILLSWFFLAGCDKEEQEVSNFDAKKELGYIVTLKINYDLYDLYKAYNVSIYEQATITDKKGKN